MSADLPVESAAERALWLGVLFQAIRDYHAQSLRAGRDDGIQRDAEEFLFSRARRDDLERVTQAAGVDTEAVLAAARAGPLRYHGLHAPQPRTRRRRRR